MAFERISPKEIAGNVFKMIDDKWMLITAGNETKFNTMTASWGGLGILWNKPAATCYVRPQRYTYGFMNDGEYYTLSFYGEEYRKALGICGSKSGRDIDKAKECGFTPAFAGCGAPYFEEAELVLVCRKMYQDDLKEEFIPDGVKAEQYALRDYHRMYIGEIIEVLKK